MPLPLKAQMALRSAWEDNQSSVHDAIQRLKDVLGRTITCEPDFPILFAELEAQYDDKGDVITAITSCIQVWFTVLADMVDDDNNEDWGYNMLDTLQHHEAWYPKLTVEVGKGTVASTLWSPSQKAFVLTLPSTVAITNPSAFAESFRDDLYEEFATPLDVETKNPAAMSSAVDAEWTDVAEVRPPKTSLNKQQQPTFAKEAPSVESLPKATELPRPNDLLARPPYRITVNARGGGVDILSCHSPSLELLEAYMTRWCRSDYDYTTKPPIVDIKLHSSPWGLGPMYDRLSMNIPKNSYQVQLISPLMPISIIEGVLGFQETYSDGSTWHFIRTVAFKE